MLSFTPLLAEVNLLWYAPPLIVVISLVYSATRHEVMRSILSHSARLAAMIAGFMLAIMAGLAFLSWRL
jgi:hypothetical protein